MMKYGAYPLNFASSSANSWSTVRSIWPVFCRSYTWNSKIADVRSTMSGSIPGGCDELLYWPG